MLMCQQGSLPNQSSALPNFEAQKREVVEEIVKVADQAKIPVFLKNNLYKITGLGNGKSILHNNDNGTLRQEYPQVKETPNSIKDIAAKINRELMQNANDKL